MSQSNLRAAALGMAANIAFKLQMGRSLTYSDVVHDCIGVLTSVEYIHRLRTAGQICSKIYTADIVPIDMADMGVVTADYHVALENASCSRPVSMYTSSSRS